MHWKWFYNKNALEKNYYKNALEMIIYYKNALEKNYYKNALEMILL